MCGKVGGQVGDWRERERLALYRGNEGLKAYLCNSVPGSENIDKQSATTVDNGHTVLLLFVIKTTKERIKVPLKDQRSYQKRERK